MAGTDAADRIAWERTLLQRIRAGERDAFGELYRAYAPALYRRVLLPKLGAAGAAEDALAETFRTAFVKLETFEHQDVSVYHWLARIASNKAIDMHRVRARTDRALTHLEQLLSWERAPSQDPFSEVCARQDHAELTSRVTATLDGLNPLLRRARAGRLRAGSRREARDVRRPAAALAACVSQGLGGGARGAGRFRHGDAREGGRR